MAWSASTKEKLAFLLTNVFKPGTPIENFDLFADRREQSQQLLGAINQAGHHAVLYGERGVGKTSMANVLKFKLKTPGWTQLTPSTNCTRGDTFSSLWARMFAVIQEHLNKHEIKLRSQVARHLRVASEGYDDHVNMETVRSVLTAVAEKAALVAIIDEFDLVAESDVRGSIADAIKYFSDRGSPFTVILVGVASNVTSLVSDHRSIERCLRQVRMPRMSRDELETIVHTCLQRVRNTTASPSMTITDGAVQEISRLSVGLPHYAHLLGQYSGLQAVEDSSMAVSEAHVNAAISPAIKNTYQTVQDAFLRATESSQVSAKYKEVLVASAMADTNTQGYFSAADVRSPLSRINKKPAKIENFSRHLHAFCEAESGPVFEKADFRGRAQFRFINPLMQPYAMLCGMADKLITGEDLKATKSPADQMRLF